MPTVRTIPVGHGTITWTMVQVGDPVPPYSVTMGFSKGSAPTVADANAVQAAFAGGFDQAIVATYSFRGARLLYQLDADLQVVVESDSAPVAGTSAGDGIAQNTALLVAKRTQFAGRAQRGRIYIPGPPESVVNSTGLLDSTYHGGLIAGVNSFFSGVSAVVQPVLLHSCFHEEGTPECVPLSPTPIIGLELDTLVATQRRRLR